MSTALMPAPGKDAQGRFIAGNGYGAPRKFQDIEHFQAAIDGYFTLCSMENKTPQLVGLARALGCHRETILNYERYDDAAPFIDAIKSARVRCEDALVDFALTPGNKVHPAIPIFLLKNNHGYRDVQEVQVDSRSVVFGVTISMDEHRKQLADVDQQIREIASRNADRPALETSAVAPDTFASTPSLSPESVNSYAVEKPAK